MGAPSEKADDELTGIAWAMPFVAIMLLSVGVLKVFFAIKASSAMNRDGQSPRSEVAEAIDRDIDGSWLFLGSGMTGLPGAAAIRKIRLRLPPSETSDSEEPDPHQARIS